MDLFWTLLLVLLVSAAIAVGGFLLVLFVRYNERHPFPFTLSIIAMIDAVIQAAEDAMDALLSFSTLVLNLVNVLLTQALQVGEAVAKDVADISEAAFTGVDQVAASLEPIGSKLVDGTVSILTKGLSDGVTAVSSIATGVEAGFGKAAGAVGDISTSLDGLVTGIENALNPTKALNPANVATPAIPGF